MFAPRQTSDVYQIFEQHSEQFQAAQTYLEFCTLIGAEFLKSYTWAAPVFATAKAGKRVHRALALPLASKFEDLFRAARFLPSDGDEAKAAKRRGFVYIGSATRSAVPSGHLGGTRGYSKTIPTVRSHYGAKFYTTLAESNHETDTIVRMGRGINQTKQGNRLCFNREEKYAVHLSG